MEGEATGAGDAPEVITYSLRNGEADSATYYRDAARFADGVVEAGAPLMPIVAGFASSVAASWSEPVRSDEEYLLELLMLGVHWRAYGDDAHDLACAPRCVLSSLAEIRRANPFLKPAADWVRGILSTLYLVPGTATGPRDRPSAISTGCSAGSGLRATTARRSSGWRHGGPTCTPCRRTAPWPYSERPSRSPHGSRR